MTDPLTAPLKKGEMRLPDGNKMTRKGMKKMLVDGIAEEFRRARNEGYRSGDWIYFAADKVVEKLFEINGYFEQMLGIQKAMAEKAGVKKRTIKKIIKQADDEK